MIHVVCCAFRSWKTSLINKYYQYVALHLDSWDMTRLTRRSRFTEVSIKFRTATGKWKNVKCSLHYNRHSNLINRNKRLPWPATTHTKPSCSFTRRPNVMGISYRHRYAILAYEIWSNMCQYLYKITMSWALLIFPQYNYVDGESGSLWKVNRFYTARVRKTRTLKDYVTRCTGASHIKLRSKQPLFNPPLFITSGAGWKCMRSSGEVGGAERKILPRARNENPILTPVNA